MPFHLKHSVENAFGGDIKGCGSASCCCDPVNGLLPMPVLVQLWNIAIVVQAVPVLTHHKVRLGGQHILADKLPPIPSYKVESERKCVCQVLRDMCDC